MRTLGLPELMVLFAILFLLGFALILLVAALRWKQSRSVQRALIEKLPPNELLGLLQTPQGEKLIQSLADAGVTPGRSILTSVRRGIVLIVTGIGLLVVAFFVPEARESRAVVSGIAVVLIFLGIGLLVAAFVSYRLSKRWRLLAENGRGSSEQRAN